MKNLKSFRHFLLTSLFLIGTNFAQSNSEIIKELYDGAYGIVEQVDDLISLSVQSVWLASSITGTVTFTGSLTQSSSNPNYWTYSYSPSDKLVLHFTNGSVIYFKFNSFDNLLMWYITGVNSASSKPAEFNLAQNYPNPFNPSTTISYNLPKSNNVLLIVYDVLGRVVKTLVNKEQSVGYHKVHFNASYLSNGIYYYRIKVGQFIETKKMILLK